MHVRLLLAQQLLERRGHGTFYTFGVCYTYAYIVAELAGSRRSLGLETI